MSSVSMAYEQSGRTRQKQRTRAALIAAARKVIAESGSSPTVAEAAEVAAVSRTTAYRYFPTQKALLIAAHPEVDATSMLPNDVSDDPEVRLTTAVRSALAIIVASEPQQRTMLRLSLAEAQRENDPNELPLRQGRAIGWFSEALEPLAPVLGADGVQRLAIAVRAVAGIEPLVWLTDVAGLSAEQAVEQMVWSAVALLRRTLADARADELGRRS